MRNVPVNCTAVIGQVSNTDHENVNLGKAGRKRHIDVYKRQLLSSGVKISEWTPGFTHAKLVVMDGVEAVVGTINLDYRSLYHHFENAVWMRRVGSIRDMETDFQDTLAHCRTVEATLQSVWQGKKLLRLMGLLLKVIAPLM